MVSNVILTVAGAVTSTVAGHAAGVVRALAFWTAVLLPLLYVPLVLVEHPSITGWWMLAQLVSLNVAAIVIGHGYAIGEEFD